MSSQGSGLIGNGPAVHQGLGMGTIHNQMGNLQLNSHQVPGVPMNYRPQPMQYPQTVMLNGIPVVPIEMPPTAKNAVYGMMQQIKPLFQHIDTLMKALYEKRGEAERPNLQILSSMKQTILLQMAGLENGIFILRPEDAAHLQSSMVNIFNYAERILLPQKPAAPEKQEPGQPQPTHSRASSTTGGKLPGMSNIDRLDPIPPKSDASQGATKIKLKEPGSSTKSRDISPSPNAKRVAAIDESLKQTINPKDDFVPIDEAAFPALGTAIEQIKPKSRSASKDSSSGFVIKRLERKGNQKQRRDESRTESPNQNGQGEKVWTLQKDGVAIPVESTQIGRAVSLVN